MIYLKFAFIFAPQLFSLVQLEWHQIITLFTIALLSAFLHSFVIPLFEGNFLYANDILGFNFFPNPRKSEGVQYEQEIVSNIEKPANQYHQSKKQ